METYKISFLSEYFYPGRNMPLNAHTLKLCYYAYYIRYLATENSGVGSATAFYCTHLENARQGEKSMEDFLLDKVTLYLRQIE